MPTVHFEPDGSVAYVTINPIDNRRFVHFKHEDDNYDLG